MIRITIEGGGNEPGCKLRLVDVPREKVML